MVAAIVIAASAAAAVPPAAVRTPPAAQQTPLAPLDGLRFLVGSWRGEGSGKPGSGGGEASFRFELDGRVLVRRSHTEYPPSGGRPAAVHDDLMVIHAVPGGRALEAIYFDNEGHVIEYDDVAISPDGRRAVFTSEAEPSQPRFRLTYARVDADTVDVTFAIAPPGAREAFKPYVSGRMRRVGRDR